MNGADPLAQLRDIHLPAPVSAWPPAPGWWLLAAILLITLAALGYWLWRRYKKTAFRKTALAELQQLSAIQQPQQCLAQLNALLKRVALLCHQHQNVAGLSGQAWLDFLNHSGNTQAFSEPSGQLLLNGPYQKTIASESLAALLSTSQQWIKRQQQAC
jgi:hypothetical protein